MGVDSRSGELGCEHKFDIVVEERPGGRRSRRRRGGKMKMGIKMEMELEMEMGDQMNLARYGIEERRTL